MVEGRRGLEVREGIINSIMAQVVTEASRCPVSVIGVSCRVAGERTMTDTRRPLSTGGETACAGFMVPCIEFQPINCRALWRPAPSSTGQVM